MNQSLYDALPDGEEISHEDMIDVFYPWSHPSWQLVRQMTHQELYEILSDFSGKYFLYWPAYQEMIHRCWKPIEDERQKEDKLCAAVTWKYLRKYTGNRRHKYDLSDQSLYGLYRALEGLTWTYGRVKDVKQYIVATIFRHFHNYLKRQTRQSEKQEGRLPEIDEYLQRKRYYHAVGYLVEGELSEQEPLKEDFDFIDFWDYFNAEHSELLTDAFFRDNEAAFPLDLEPELYATLKLRMQGRSAKQIAEIQRVSKSTIDRRLRKLKGYL